MLILKEKVLLVATECCHSGTAVTVLSTERSCSGH